jgi:hypothetical protein
MPDRQIHIHQFPSNPCIACGDADTADTHFLTDPTAWNREARTCSPSMRLRPDYSISGRADPRTSALKDERQPDRRRFRSLR